MMKRLEKEKLVDDIVSAIKESKALVFSDYKGVKVKDLTRLRGELRKTGSTFRVFKKTLLHIALGKSGIDADARGLEGQVGVAFGTDEVVAARTIADFAKANKGVPIAIVGGTLEGKVLSAEEVGALAKLPGRDELRAQLVGTLQAPIGAFVRTLSGTYGGFVRVLGAVAESRK